MEPLDADLLRMVQWDGKTESIWFRHIIELTSLYFDRIPTRKALEEELHRLHRLGWIDSTAGGQWAITGAGIEALSTARQWAFEVDEVVDEIVYEDRTELVETVFHEVVVVGRLTAGSVAFFLGGDFTISRNGANSGGGHVSGVGSIEGDDFAFVALLNPGGDAQLQPGDALDMHEFLTQ
jgi:hypothetical protein